MGSEVELLRVVLQKVEQLEEKVNKNVEVLASLDTYLRGNGLSTRLEEAERRIDMLYKWIIGGFIGVIVAQIVIGLLK